MLNQTIIYCFPYNAVFLPALAAFCEQTHSVIANRQDKMVCDVAGERQASQPCGLCCHYSGQGCLHPAEINLASHSNTAFSSVRSNLNSDVVAIKEILYNSTGLLHRIAVVWISEPSLYEAAASHIPTAILNSNPAPAL